MATTKLCLSRDTVCAQTWQKGIAPDVNVNVWDGRCHTWALSRCAAINSHLDACWRLSAVTQILLPSADISTSPADRPQKRNPPAVTSQSAVILLNMVNEEKQKWFERKAICELKAAAPTSKLSQMISSSNWVGLPITDTDWKEWGDCRE